MKSVDSVSSLIAVVAHKALVGSELAPSTASHCTGILVRLLLLFRHSLSQFGKKVPTSRRYQHLLITTVIQYRETPQLCQH